MEDEKNALQRLIDNQGKELQQIIDEGRELVEEIQAKIEQMKAEQCGTNPLLWRKYPSPKSLQRLIKISRN
jgi:hypothetical protein